MTRALPKLVGGGLTLLLVGMMVTLFQNCSAGSLPAGLNDAASVGPVIPSAPLSITPGSTTVATTDTTALTITGGSGQYTVTTDVGTVTNDPMLASWVFTAPATVGSGTAAITVSDGITTLTRTIGLTAATVVNPPPSRPSNWVIYQWYNGDLQKHSSADANGFGEAGQNMGPSYLLMADATQGGVPFYRCRIVNTAGTISFFATRDQACENTGSTGVQIGFIYPPGAAAPADTKPLYRMTWIFAQTSANYFGKSTIDYIETVDPNGVAHANPNAPYQADPNILGYVPNSL